MKQWNLWCSTCEKKRYSWLMVKKGWFFLSFPPHYGDAMVMIHWWLLTKTTSLHFIIFSAQRYRDHLHERVSKRKQANFLTCASTETPTRDVWNFNVQKCHKSWHRSSLRYYNSNRPADVWKCQLAESHLTAAMPRRATRVGTISTDFSVTVVTHSISSSALYVNGNVPPNMASPT